MAADPPTGTYRVVVIDSTTSDQIQSELSDTFQRVQERSASKERGSDDSELCGDLKWLQRTVRFRMKISPVPQAEWFAAQNDELIDVYLRLALAEEFFEEEPALVAAVLAGLAAVAELCQKRKDMKSGESILSRCTVVFQRMWENRERLKRINPKEPELDINCHPVVFAVSCFALLHRYVRKCWADSGTYLGHVSLFAWVYLDVDCYPPAGLMFLSSSNVPVGESIVDVFIQDVVLDAIGVKAFFARFEKALEDIPGGDDVHSIWDCMMTLVSHSKFQAFSRQRETFKRVVAWFTRRAHTGESQKPDPTGECRDWSSTSRLLFQLVFEDLNEASGPEVTFSGVLPRGEDVVTYLAHGTKLVARAISCRRYAKLSEMSQDIALGLEWLHMIVTSPPRRARVPDFVNGVSRKTREEWRSILALLQGEEQSLNGGVDGYGKLIGAWVKLGVAMDIDEDAEQQKRLEFCSHQLCPYSRKTPPNALSTCKGCGDVRYCGRDCQRGDWKWHKKVCGNRLK